MDKINNIVRKLLKNDNDINNKSFRINGSDLCITRGFMYGNKFSIKSYNAKYLEEHDVIKVICFKKNK